MDIGEYMEVLNRAELIAEQKKNAAQKQHSKGGRKVVKVNTGNK